MFEGVFRPEKILKGAHRMDNFDGQRFVIDRNSVENMLDHSGEFVIHHQLAKIQCDAHFEHPQSVDHVDPCQRGKQTGECLFMAGLGITDFAVALTTGCKTGNGIFSGQLGGTGGNHTAFRRSHRGRGAP